MHINQKMRGKVSEAIIVFVFFLVTLNINCFILHPNIVIRERKVYKDGE
jgi:hypothetical protein